jgi:hypothetical protein
MPDVAAEAQGTHQNARLARDVTAHTHGLDQ